MSAASETTESTANYGSALETLRVFLHLGLTSFGGPVAHLGYFRAEILLELPSVKDRATGCR
jgi:chromate transporter